MIGAVCF